MIQNYTLKTFVPSDFKDDYGNTWCNATFEGVGEPVKWVLRDPTKPVLGQEYYGEITEETSRKGGKYLRFRPKNAEDQAAPSDKPTEEYWDAKNAQIKAQWAIGQAVQIFTYEQTEKQVVGLGGIESTAKELFEMVDRVKEGMTGYDKAKAVAYSLKEPAPSDEDYQASLGSSFDKDGYYEPN